MRTADSVSPSLTGANVLLSLLLYVAVYLIIYPVGLSVMLRLVWRGPAAADDDAPVVRAAGRNRPSRPWRPQQRSTARCHARPGADLDGDPRRRRLLLCRARRLRPRRRHALQFCAQPRRARPDHELDRADLGRQRDLAHSGKPRPACRFPGRLRHHHSGGLFSDPADAARLDLPRAGVRIPLSQTPSTARSGITVLPQALRWRLSRKASSWVRSSRASTSRDASLSAARSTASRRFRFSAASP